METQAGSSNMFEVLKPGILWGLWKFEFLFRVKSLLSH